MSNFDRGTLPPAPVDDDLPELPLQELWRAVVRHHRLVLAITATTVVLAALYTWRQEPLYESEATLLISSSSAETTIFPSEFSTLVGGSRGMIETEMLVLRSRQVAEAVVDSLDLAVELLAPDTERHEVLRVLSVPRDAETGTFTLTRTSGTSYRLRPDGSAAGVPTPSTVRIGEPFSIGSSSLALAPSLRSAPPAQIRFAIRPFRASVSSVQDQMKVYRPDPNAQVVGVRYTSGDPYLAATVPNAATRLFIDYRTQGTKARSRGTVDFLEEQVESYRAQLARAEEALRTFREQQQVVSPTEEATEQVQRLAELQAERDALRSERDALAQLLARVRDAPQTSQGGSPYRLLASFPTFLANRAVQDMLQSLTELENERASLLIRRTPQHTDVEGLNQRIREIELQLFQIARNYLEGLDSKIASTEDNLRRFENELRSIPARELEFARLTRQQELLAEMYTLLQTRLKEAELREAVDPADIRVLDPALVPRGPVYPRPLRNLLLGAALGLALGVAAAIVRAALDSKVRSREDLQRVARGAPILGTIPRLSSAGGNGVAVVRRRNGHRRTVPSFLRSDEDELVTRLDPRSPVPEAYRMLRTNVDLLVRTDERQRVLVLTSALTGEGQMASASNLAITLAQHGTRTLLVDADLREGALAEWLGANSEPGLADVLRGEASLDEAVQTLPAGSEGASLHFLAAGAHTPDAAGLFGAGRMREVLDELRRRYDVVLLGAPPLNLMADAAALSVTSDAVILVARTGTTEKRALEHAIDELRLLGAPIGGVILNGTAPQWKSRDASRRT